jgi:2-(1,2-epoxy-1,2-dihydrophenyl)acetyl-CoA isomerase
LPGQPTGLSLPESAWSAACSRNSGSKGRTIFRKPPCLRLIDRMTTDMTYEFLLYEVRDGVLTITLNRPDNLNSFNDEMSFELQKALKDAEKDKAVRAIILTGAGRGFSAGQDLKARSIQAENGGKPKLGDSVRKRYAPIVSKLRSMEKPVIALVNGVAAGAGASIAFACDMRVAVKDAKFIQAFVKVGLIPDSGACWLLPRLIGYGRALDLALSGDAIDAQKAYEWGLVNCVKDTPEEALAAAQELANRFAQGPAYAIGLIKRAMNKAMTTGFDEYLDYEAQLQEVAGRTDDYTEGVAAFTEKRPPVFSGR